MPSSHGIILDFAIVAACLVPVLVLYTIENNSPEYTRRKIHEFTDFLRSKCGINADADLYHDSESIVSWPEWTIQKFNECVNNNGYVILLWSRAMEILLKHRDANDNSSINMVFAHIDRHSLLSLINLKLKHIIVVCLDSVMPVHQIRNTLPFNLMNGTVYSISLQDIPDNMPTNELLELEQFSAVKDLIAKLTRQQQFERPGQQIAQSKCYNGHDYNHMFLFYSAASQMSGSPSFSEDCIPCTTASTNALNQLQVFK